MVFYITITFLLSAGNESCPQPQTSEHLAAIEIMKLKHILILQNKIDLVKESQAKEQYEQILAFVQGKLSMAEVWSVVEILHCWENCFYVFMKEVSYLDYAGICGLLI